MQSIRINSYFSGAGIFEIGFNQEGLEIQESFELDSKAVQTQRANFGHKVKECDISQKLVKQEKEPNVIVGTYPCTKYSTAGDIHNVRTGDDLYLHFFRHVAIQRPDVYIMENVPGLLKFPLVVEAMTKLPDYYVNVFCPVDANKWLPQNRKRLIIIGSRRYFNWREEEAPNKPVTLADIIESEPQDYKQLLTKGCYDRMNGKYRDLPIVSDPYRGDVAPTCVAHYHKDRSTRMLKDDKSPIGARPYTVREWARLQGVPDWFQFPVSDNEAYKQIGNAVPVPMGRWVAKELKRYFAPYKQQKLSL